ncbi:MAG: hypothetical protein WCG25_01470 [bacterium]
MKYSITHWGKTFSNSSIFLVAIFHLMVDHFTNILISRGIISLSVSLNTSCTRALPVMIYLNFGALLKI